MLHIAQIPDPICGPPEVKAMVNPTNRTTNREYAPERTRRFPATTGNYHSQDWINVILAIWLFISPWVLGFGTTVNTAAPNAAAASPMDVAYTAAWNAWVLGVIVFLVAVSAAMRRGFWQGSWQEWSNVILGIWIFIAPWVLGFANLQLAAWDHWVVGFLIFIVSLSNLYGYRHTPTPA
jgi:hypothetical protein